MAQRGESARWKALAATLFAVAVGVGVYAWTLRSELSASLAAAADLRRRLERAERSLGEVAAEARRAQEASSTAAERAREESQRAAKESERAASAGDLAASLRSEAQTARERAQRQAERLESVQERAARLERELAGARDQVESALSAVRAAEERARQAEARAGDGGQALQAARKQAADARGALQEVERVTAARLAQARAEVERALRQYDRALAESDQADSALELALRSRPAAADELGGGGRPLHDYRTVRDRADRAEDSARKRLQAALDTLSRE